MPVVELNQMELEFLKMTDFSLMVTIDELIQAGESLVHFSIHYRPGIDYALPPLIPNPSNFNPLLSPDRDPLDDSRSSSLSSSY